MIDDDPRETAAIMKWNCALYIKRKNRVLKFKIFKNWKNLLTISSTVSPVVNKSATLQINEKKQTNKKLQEELNQLIDEQKQLEVVSSQLKSVLSQKLQTSQTNSFSKITK
ncbi:hypothetical protein TVAG_416230 [Trichomonas vaginalis G3]|uniref:Uncharacterized protein n=1 Tax=Trichomonas vaginalis (strain ATCC PRA-98 / G3) TaxID=412133 RepID=A2FQ54_TRIV3|nr:hypothetical protein TVAGG3_0748400 [Trichomonas vaginalis G3]EAX92961.1 hypothetical protein TVAG_416230 [Trichomonas vaginalis G3]KAI5512350.1 hypothetical protein TVAGG3_0748400 [Trichomonas vaginalis G3]|eukprot:XP_001305891.1 hypothetical protein [Trichomonas vaginalis G3]